MDIYSYLFKDIKKTTNIVFSDIKYKITKSIDEKNIIYTIKDWATLTIYKNFYYSIVEREKKEYDKNADNNFLDLIKVINNYNYVNYCILKDRLLFHNVEYSIVNSLSGFKNIYLEKGYMILQDNVPTIENVDILLSNSYYFDKYFREFIDVIINLKIKEFIKTLKKIYGKDFSKTAYLKDIKSLEKFDYTIKEFILDKANLNFISCYNFFYKNMGKILDDLSLLPKKFIIFYR